MIRRRIFYGTIVGLILLAGWLDIGQRQPTIRANLPRNTKPILAGTARTVPATFDNPTAIPAVDPAVARAALVALVTERLCAWEDHDDPAQREQQLQELDQLLNVPHPLEIVQALPPDLWGYAFALPAMHAQLLADPAGTLEWLSQHPQMAQSRLQTFLHDWGEQNPDARQQYLDQLPPDGAWRQSVLAAVSSEQLTSDPASALTWAGQLAPGSTRTRLLTMSAVDWAEHSPAEAQAWADQISDPALHNQLAGAVAVGLAQNDPVGAATYLADTATDGAGLAQPLAGIVSAWAMKDPVAASAWVAQFPPGTARQQTLQNLLAIWSNHDLNAATTWVETLTNPALQTEAARYLLAILPAEPNH